MIDNINHLMIHIPKPNHIERSSILLHITFMYNSLETNAKEEFLTELASNPKYKFGFMRDWMTAELENDRVGLIKLDTRPPMHPTIPEVLDFINEIKLPSHTGYDIYATCSTKTAAKVRKLVDKIRQWISLSYINKYNINFEIHANNGQQYLIMALTQEKIHTPASGFTSQDSFYFSIPEELKAAHEFITTLRAERDKKTKKTWTR